VEKINESASTSSCVLQSYRLARKPEAQIETWLAAKSDFLAILTLVTDVPIINYVPMADEHDNLRAVYVQARTAVDKFDNLINTLTSGGLTVVGAISAYVAKIVLDSPKGGGLPDLKLAFCLSLLTVILTLNFHFKSKFYFRCLMASKNVAERIEESLGLDDDARLTHQIVLAASATKFKWFFIEGVYWIFYLAEAGIICLILYRACLK
jgi:hypothetical protein